MNRKPPTSCPVYGTACALLPSNGDFRSMACQMDSAIESKTPSFAPTLDSLAGMTRQGSNEFGALRPRERRRGV